MSRNKKLQEFDRKNGNQDNSSSVLRSEKFTEERYRQLETEVIFPLFNWSNRIIDHCKEHGLPIDAVFYHKHLISPSNGIGEIKMLSLYVQSPDHIPPGTRPHSVMTGSVFRCHDHHRFSYLISLPSDGDPDKFFSDFLNTERRENAFDFRPVSYSVCKKLIKECLIRMKKSKKVLIGKENRAVVRLYDMDSHSSSSQKKDAIPKMPTPSPAPSVEAMWMTLNRPEYFHWIFFEELIEKLPQNYCITRENLPGTLRYIAKEQKYRERIYRMIEMNCLWYMLEDESEVASWLLWELQSMKDFDEGHEEGAIIALEQNIIIQLLVGRLYINQRDLKILSPVPDFKKDGNFGEALRNHYVYRCDLMYHGTVPPGLIYNADIAKASVRSFPAEEKITAGVNQVVDELEKLDISDISTALRRRRNGCAICGATRFKGGGKLRECMKCKSVVYCCREHQKLHWKNGHKRECCSVR